MNDRILVIASYVKTINYAVQQNGVPIVNRLRIKNVTSERIDNLEVSIEFDPECSLRWNRQVPVIEPEEIIEIDDLNVSLSAKFLFGLSRRVDGNIIISVSKDDEIYGKEIGDVSILSYDEWCGIEFMPELLSSYVISDHPYIAKLIKNAGEYLKEWGLEPYFDGYVSKESSIVKKQIAAIYSAIRNENITLCDGIPKYETVGQKIRVCDKIEHQKVASNLEMSLLYASCLEAVGLNPLIIFTKKHVLTGCMMTNDNYSEPVQDDYTLINKKIAEGIEEVCVVDPDCMFDGKEGPFEVAITTAQRKMADASDFELFIDVKRCRNEGVNPLPIRIKDEKGEYNESEYRFVCKRDDLLKKDSDYLSKEEGTKFDVAKTEENASSVLTKQALWERKLLDLSLRNTLVNFRVNQKNVQILTPDLVKVADGIFSDIEYKIVARPKDLEHCKNKRKIYEYKELDVSIDDEIDKEFREGKLCTFLDEKSVIRNVVSIYRQARMDLEENGSNSLYIAFGFLKWYETDRSTVEKYAPLVLVPIEIKRKSSVKGYVIKVRDEEPQINITLLEMLKRDYDIKVPQLEHYKFTGEETGADFLEIFTIIRKAVMHKSRWDVCNYAFVGIFSFSQFIMYNDLRMRENILKDNKIIASLIEGKLMYSQEDEDISEKDLDDMSMLELAVPMSADSSQLLAVCQTAKNNSFVLHGPPGTGKSQTITNIIANALYQGKSVLFIAEKRAALSVVQKRLASIGLGPFCLELHSNKAKKRDVLSQLDKVLNIARTKAPKEYVTAARKLHCLRKELNDTVTSLHKKRSSGFTLYEMISIAMKYENYPQVLRISTREAVNITRQDYDNWVSVADELSFSAKAVGGVYNNPLNDFEISNYSKMLKKDITEILITYKEKNESLRQAMDEFANGIGIINYYSVRIVENVINFARAIENIKIMPKELIMYNNLSDFSDDVDNLCMCGSRIKQIEERILNVFDARIFKEDYVRILIDLREAKNSGFFSRKRKIANVLSSIERFVKDEEYLRVDIIEKYLYMIKDRDEAIDELRNNEDLYKNFFGKMHEKAKLDFDEINNLFWQAIKIRKTIDVFMEDESEDTLDTICSAVFTNIVEYKKKNASLFEKIQKDYAIINGLEERLVELAGIRFKELDKLDNWLEDMTSKVDGWLDSIDNLREWQRYMEVRNIACNVSLGAIVDALESGKIKEDDVVCVVKKDIAESLAYAIIEEEEHLARFSKAAFEREIKKYKDANEKFENLTKKELIARLSSKVPIPADSAAKSSEIGILKRAIKNGGRMLSIRRLFDTIPNLIRKLCPCMLMSPISAAQYINSDYPQFDLVIFDEASQLPTCEAIGAISRGNNLVVVGDEMQLPPTSFFNSNKVDEDNMEREDLDSILDDCLALSMPSRHLLWHYRSRHESLIAFSNREYYDNKMYTFPSPKDLMSEVEFVGIDGYYDRGKTKQNKEEAKAVVKEIVRRLEDEELRKESIGVVTFSLVQQNLIEDLLMEEFEKNHELEEISDGMYEPIFIKNLENVQGDERDVIMFSVGYGPDKEGKVGLNFGPLNRDGGEKRLNVAVSRARSKMIIYSTLRPEQIDLSKTMSEGVKDLKAFLEYALYGKESLATKVSSLQEVNNEQEDTYYEQVNIEEDIADKIRQLGYKVKTGIGCSKYKVDIGVVNPNNESEYVLGILCDGANYKNAATARDRNILQESVLRSLGWNLYRVWTLDWWDSQKKIMEQLQKKIEEAIYFEDKKQKKMASLKKQQKELEERRKKAAKQNSSYSKEIDAKNSSDMLKEGVQDSENAQTMSEVNIANDTNGIDIANQEDNKSIEKETEKVSSSKKDKEIANYNVTDLSDTGLTCVDSKEFLKKHNTYKIREQMIKVIKCEAPISRKLLCKRIYEAWGISRKGVKVDARIEEIVSGLKLETTTSESDTFYWDAGQKSKDYTLFRVPVDDKAKRTLDEISPQEIANAINYLLQRQVSMSLTDLEKEIGSLFGFSRNNKVIQMAVAKGIEEAIDREYAVYEGDRILLKD